MSPLFTPIEEFGKYSVQCKCLNGPFRGLVTPGEKKCFWNTQILITIFLLPNIWSFKIQMSFWPVHVHSTKKNHVFMINSTKSVPDVTLLLFSLADCWAWRCFWFLCNNVRIIQYLKKHKYIIYVILRLLGFEYSV